jgi:hypothetical protein
MLRCWKAGQGLIGFAVMARIVTKKSADKKITKTKLGASMPQGDKSIYTDKQKRQARHIEAGYEKKGLSTKTAEARAWATVNKITGGGKKSGSGRKKG